MAITSRADGPAGTWLLPPGPVPKCEGFGHDDFDRLFGCPSTLSLISQSIWRLCSKQLGAWVCGHSESTSEDCFSSSDQGLKPKAKVPKGFEQGDKHRKAAGAATIRVHVSCTNNLR